MQLGQSIRQADSSHITEFQEASVSNSRICRYPKEAPPEGEATWRLNTLKRHWIAISLIDIAYFFVGGEKSGNRKAIPP